MKKLKTIHYHGLIFAYDFTSMMRCRENGQKEEVYDINGKLHVDGWPLNHNVQTAYQQYLLEKILLGQED